MSQYPSKPNNMTERTGTQLRPREGGNNNQSNNNQEESTDPILVHGDKPAKPGAYVNGTEVSNVQVYSDDKEKPNSEDAMAAAYGGTTEAAHYMRTKEIPDTFSTGFFTRQELQAGFGKEKATVEPLPKQGKGKREIDWSDEDPSQKDPQKQIFFDEPVSQNPNPATPPPAPQIYPAGQSPLDKKNKVPSAPKTIYDSEPPTTSPSVKAASDRSPQLELAQVAHIQEPSISLKGPTERVSEFPQGRDEIGTLPPLAIPTNEETISVQEQAPVPANPERALNAVVANTDARAQRAVAQSPWKQRLFGALADVRDAFFSRKGVLVASALVAVGGGLKVTIEKKPEAVAESQQEVAKQETEETESEKQMQNNEQITTNPEQKSQEKNIVINRGEGISQALMSGGVQFQDMMKALKEINVTIGDKTVPLADTFVIARGGGLGMKVQQDSDGKVTAVSFVDPNDKELTPQQLSKKLAIADWRVEKEKRQKAEPQPSTTAFIDTSLLDVSALPEVLASNTLNTSLLDVSALPEVRTSNMLRASQMPQDRLQAIEVQNVAQNDSVATSNNMPSVQVSPFVARPEAAQAALAPSDAENTPSINQENILYAQQIHALEEYIDDSQRRIVSVGKLLFRRVGASSPKYQVAHQEERRQWVDLSPRILTELNKKYGLDFTPQAPTVDNITLYGFDALVNLQSTVEIASEDYTQRVKELEEAMRLTAKFGLPIDQLNTQYAALTGESFEPTLTEEEMPTERVAAVVSPEESTEVPLLLADEEAPTALVPRLPKLSSEEPTELMVSREPSTVLMQQLGRVVDQDADTEPLERSV